MKQLDKQLETSPTEQAVKELAELRLRNIQTFAELQSFNDTGRFLCRHPLLSYRSEIEELRRLLRSDPSEFLHRHRLVADNLRRYRAFLKRPDRQDRRQQDRRQLNLYQERDRLMRTVLSERNDSDERP